MAKTTAKRKPIIWDFDQGVHVLKVAEGGPHVPGLLQALKEAGIPARRAHSCLVGHTLIVTAKGTRTARRRIFRDYGITWSN